MRPNLIAYLRQYGNKSFEELPFSEVDSLILTEMSYFKFDGLVPGFRHGMAVRRPVTLKELQTHPDMEKMFSDEVFGKRYRELFELVCAGRRFGRTRVNYFVNYVDKAKEMQFSAVTFFLENRVRYIAYRGTDETLIGWKENFNMAYMEPVPAQRAALSYSRKVAGMSRGPLMIGGHSKGGNLAVYVAACCEPAYQKRILTVYSFDGPGFSREFYVDSGYRRIQDKICKIVPAYSVVGMILDNEMGFRPVDSFGAGLLQHDPFTWVIKNGRFQYRHDIYRRVSHKTKVLNLWIDSLSARQIQDFVDISYGVLTASQAKTVYELSKGPMRRLFLILKALRGLDQGARKILALVLGRLLHFKWKSAEETLKSSVSAVSDNRKQKRRQSRSR